MADVHPTAVIEGDVALAEDVSIGPGCVLTGPITIGSGTRLRGNVYLQGPLTIGERNAIYPFVCLGFAPQSVGHDSAAPGRGLEIGRDNTLREGVSLHRAMTDEGPTRVGDHNFFMANSHAGHDCQIGSHGVFANGTLFAGHVTVGDRVTTGGHAAAHQFSRIGHGAMVAGFAAPIQDLPPWFICTALNVCGGVNLIGLRRNGFTSKQIEAVRWVYKTLYRNGKSIKAATEDLRQRADDSLVGEYITFIEATSRGICPAQGKKARGTA